MLSRLVGFVRAGYPDVAPRTGHVSLFALCPRRLCDDDVRFLTSVLTKAGPPVTQADVRAAITTLIRDAASSDDCDRVSRRLADDGWLVLDGSNRCIAATTTPRPVAKGDDSTMTIDDLTGPRLVNRLAHLAEAAPAREPIEDVFADVCASAVELIDGASHADVMLIRDDHVVSVGATSDLSVRLDELQRRFGEGPCADAAFTATTVRADDFRTETRWREYAPAAAELGMRSCLSYRLYGEGRIAATMNVFGHEPDVWDEEAETIGEILAAHAAAAITASRWGATVHSTLSLRDRIGQAKGILMERYGVDDVRAFEILRRLSQEARLPLAELAQRVVDTRTPGASESVAD
ncbi:hypothetical protein GCM10023114_54150 [Mycolicibacterium sediminis]|uniref:ANTAR domain-containing protein n=1 Tax=Mycolicibacterium sediminis TaxID=1286180 RepID=A0A7I7QKM2_9MYCO|nr:hypothetical protein MSEDJ_09270 [Mycolicibacterium sediminis]